MAAKILFKYASRSRIDLFYRGLLSILDNLANNEDYFILCTFDLDDKEYNNREFIDRLMQYKNVSYYFGTSKNKTDAINRDLAFAPPFDILVNFSDDQVFLVHGFDDIIRADMDAHFSDTDGFLHYPDGSVAHDQLSTLSIIGKKYFDRTGYIYNPEYDSVYCDNEATVVAKKLGKHIFINKQILSHNHPAWGKAEVDDLYKRNEHPNLYAKDHQTFLRRQTINFDL